MTHSIQKNYFSLCVLQIGLINTSLIAMNAMSVSNGGRGGIILNVASIAGLTVLQYCPIYNASKHGVVGFTRSMAGRLIFNHSVNNE